MIGGRMKVKNISLENSMSLWMASTKMAPTMAPRKMATTD